MQFYNFSFVLERLWGGMVYPQVAVWELFDSCSGCVQILLSLAP